MFLLPVSKLAHKVGRFLEVWHHEGFSRAVSTALKRRHPDSGIHPSYWMKRHTPTAKLLQKFRERTWPADAPTFSILVPVYNTAEPWLRELVESVLKQTYTKWQLVLANDGSPSPHIVPLLEEFAKRDSRITVVNCPQNRGVSAASNAALAAATGEYVCLADHDDVLEPHALHRLAEAVLSENRPDLMYTDEAITRTDIRDIIVVRARPAFSYDYYLNHPYIVHFIATKTELARRVQGWNETMTISQDVDLVLRLLEVAKQVTHIPDVLYRWRTHPASLGHQQKARVIEATTGALRRHLERIGVRAVVGAHETHFNVFTVHFPPQRPAKVCVIIPTKNQVDLLRDCIESLERTLPAGVADIFVLDHESDDPNTHRYLAELRTKHRVGKVSGPFNFSAIMNAGVKQICGEAYTHYLFLNNDMIAPRPGWLEAMLEFGCRKDVGCVGAMLVYPDGTVQHAGVVVGLGRVGPADHAYRGAKFSTTYFERAVGDNGSLVCNRDYSAVTAACLLMRKEVFEQVGGFDEKLAVGYNDTDLCLRVLALGYKSITATEAVLIHFESKSRGTEDKHPNDTKLFLERYAEMLANGDPYFNPQLKQNNTHMAVLGDEPEATEFVRFRTVEVKRPTAM